MRLTDRRELVPTSSMCGGQVLKPFAVSTLVSLCSLYCGTSPLAEKNPRLLTEYAARQGGDQHASNFFAVHKRGL